MTNDPKPTKNVALALAAALAAIGALWLVGVAAFPYFYGESGSARYAREHRVEAFAEVVGAAILLWVSWRCVRASFSMRAWMIIGGFLIAVGVFRSVAAYRRAPAHARLAGGNWYVVTTPQPGGIDTVYYSVYYKHAGHYQSIEDLAAEFHFVAPDCLVYRGLKVSGRPMYAMCGYRSPVAAADTSIDESELLRQARLRPPFREGWALPP